MEKTSISCSWPFLGVPFVYLCPSMSAGLARCTFFFQNLRAFFKKCSPPSVASTFFKQISSMLHMKSHFFDAHMPLIRTIFITFGRSCGSIARSLRSLSAPGHLQKTPVARVPCTFRFQGHVYINDCMQHTFNFLNFVCYLPSSSCLQYSTHMFFVFFLFVLQVCFPPLPLPLSSF